jgi:hypothetical protein
MLFSNSHSRIRWVLASTLSLAACSESHDTPRTGPGTGGFAATGGASGTANGGTPSSGGGGSSGVASGGATGSGGVSPAAGGMSATGGSTPSGGGGMGQTGDAAAPDASTAGDTGSLPPVTDLGAPGPFTPIRTQSTGPGNRYELFHPKELEQRSDIKFPIVSFGPGALSNCALYLTLMNHLASHGFVVPCFNATPAGKELIDGIDWMIQEAGATSGKLAGKLDTDHIAVSGQSAGSLGTFAVAMDPRITTTVHLQGGTFAPHTTLANLRAPAQFLCGETPPSGGDGNFVYDLANPNCEYDFQNAKVPVFYGSLKGGAHAQMVDYLNQPTDAEHVRKKKANFAAMVGWLRWRLAGDKTQRALFVGPSCTLCAASSGWTVRQKDLDGLD